MPDNYLKLLLRKTGILRPILDIGGIIAFLYGTFSEKRAFYFLARLKQMSVSTICNENIF